MYYFYNKYIAINITHPFRTLIKAKKLFKVPKLKFYFGKIKHFPVYYFRVGTLFSLGAIDVQWKDKYDTPRHEQNPIIYITFFNVGILFEFTWGNCYNDLDYWEQVIYTIYYCNSDVKKAKQTWPWQDFETKKSSWNDNYLVK